MAKTKQRCIFILSVSSDIGRDLAHRYLASGCKVFGTYRSKDQVKSLEKNPDCVLVRCDVSSDQAILNARSKFAQTGWKWDVFISCVGTPLPLTSFFDGDFPTWRSSVMVNCIQQLQALYALYPYRQPKMAHAAFFAAGGANNAVVNMSAYTASKIMLTKMCEFLDAENKDLNIFIVGPGWTKTKVHNLVLKDNKVSSKKKAETQRFLKTETGTPLADIFDCINWLIGQGKTVASGRNFSVVHDPWKGQGAVKLSAALRLDTGMYKLKRHKNDFNQDTKRKGKKG